MIGYPRCYCWCNPQSLVNPHKIVVHKVNRYHRDMILNPLRRFPKNDLDALILLKLAVQAVRPFKHGYHRSLETRDDFFSTDDS